MGWHGGATTKLADVVATCRFEVLQGVKVDDVPQNTILTQSHKGEDDLLEIATKEHL